jgi:hypothetical protein
MRNNEENLIKKEKKKCLTLTNFQLKYASNILQFKYQIHKLN